MRESRCASGPTYDDEEAEVGTPSSQEDAVILGPDLPPGTQLSGDPEIIIVGEDGDPEAPRTFLVRR